MSELPKLQTTTQPSHYCSERAVVIAFDCPLFASLWPFQPSLLTQYCVVDATDT